MAMMLTGIRAPGAHQERVPEGALEIVQLPQAQQDQRPGAGPVRAGEVHGQRTTARPAHSITSHPTRAGTVGPQPGRPCRPYGRGRRTAGPTARGDGEGELQQDEPEVRAGGWHAAEFSDQCWSSSSVKVKACRHTVGRYPRPALPGTPPKVSGAVATVAR